MWCEENLVKTYEERGKDGYEKTVMIFYKKEREIIKSKTFSRSEIMHLESK